MRLYFELVAFIVATIAILGFALPFLISAASTELVAIGIALIGIYIPLAYKMVVRLGSAFIALVDKKLNSENN